MIVDTLEQWPCYRFGPAWGRAMGYLESLGPDVADGRYEIDGAHVYAMVMSYETKCPDPPLFEAHRAYADVQAALSGTEALEWAPVGALAPTGPFDPDKDAGFYGKPAEVTRVELRPGLFALLLPHDAHMPGVMAGPAPEAVKKVVVKIRADLLVV